MKIADSAIELSSSHTLKEYTERRESLVAWKQGEQAHEIQGKGNRGNALEAMAQELAEEAASVSLSTTARRATPVKAKADPLPDDERVMANLNMRILRALFEKITGRKIRLMEPPVADQAAEPVEVQQGNEQVAPEQELEGWGVAYDYYESHYEYESTQFNAQGVIMTEDGQQIDFSVDVNMSREFMSEHQISFRAGDALKDPLVINFDGGAAALTETKFSFDIDSDGRENQISFVRPGSGFLALDQNSDGIINDGSELFGPRSGDGFEELAAHDLDNNNWIDENDAIYDRLRIWSKTTSGEDQLLALGEKGVGAIYLGHIATPFAVNDTANELQGQVRASGVFLNEDGRVGTVQQVDLVA